MVKKITYFQYAKKVAEKNNKPYKDVVKDSKTLARYRMMYLQDKSKPTSRKSTSDKPPMLQPPPTRKLSETAANYVKKRNAKLLQTMNTRETPDGYYLTKEGLPARRIDYNNRTDTNMELQITPPTNTPQEPTPMEAVVRDNKTRVLWMQFEEANSRLRSAIVGVNLNQAFLNQLRASVSVTEQNAAIINEHQKAISSLPLFIKTEGIINYIQQNPDNYSINPQNYNKIKKLVQMLINESEIGGLAISCNQNVLLPVYINITRAWEQYNSAAAIYYSENINSLSNIVGTNPRLQGIPSIFTNKPANVNILFFDYTLYPVLFHIKFRDLIKYSNLTDAELITRKKKRSGDKNTIKKGNTAYFNVSADLGSNLQEYYKRLGYDTFYKLYRSYAEIKLAANIDASNPVNDLKDKMRLIYAQLSGDSTAVVVDSADKLRDDLAKRLDLANIESTNTRAELARRLDAANAEAIATRDALANRLDVANTEAAATREAIGDLGYDIKTLASGSIVGDFPEEAPIDDAATYVVPTRPITDTPVAYKDNIPFRLKAKQYQVSKQLAKDFTTASAQNTHSVVYVDTDQFLGGGPTFRGFYLIQALAARKTENGLEYYAPIVYDDKKEKLVMVKPQRSRTGSSAREFYYFLNSDAANTVIVDTASFNPNHIISHENLEVIPVDIEKYGPISYIKRKAQYTNPTASVNLFNYIEPQISEDRIKTKIKAALSIDTPPSAKTGEGLVMDGNMRLVKPYKKVQFNVPRQRGGAITSDFAEYFKPQMLTVVDSNSSIIKGITSQLYKVVL